MCAFLVAREKSQHELAILNSPGFERVVKIDNELPIDGLVQISREAGILFCRESAAGNYPDLQRDVMVALGKPLSISDILSRLIDTGYGFKKYGTVIHVTAPSIKYVTNNPLDQHVDDFRFDGTHKEFRDRILRVFKSAHISDIEFDSDLPNIAKIELHMKMAGRITLRDVLMEIADKNRIGWHAKVISEKNGSYSLSIKYTNLPEKIDLPKLRLPQNGDL